MKKIVLLYVLMLCTVCGFAQQYVCHTEKLHVAVVMPFDLDNGSQSVEARKALDFYRGVLLTVDSLKRAGISLNVMALDEGSAQNSLIQKVVNSPMLREADVIIGPGRNVNVGAMKAFAAANHIPLAVPFTNTLNLANGNPYVFQCNTPHENHYQRLFERFVRNHNNANVIFVDINDHSQNEQFVGQFTRHLANVQMPFYRLHFADFDDSLKVQMDSTRLNVFIPSTTSAKTFEMVSMKLNDMNLSSTYDIQLIGSPEWQTLPYKSQQNMFKYRATFFSTFYTNNRSTRTKNFNSKFESAFKTQQYQSFPRYGEMGHDISAFFLTAIQKYGNQLFNFIHQHDFNSLQLPMRFVRSDGASGFTNKSSYIIYYYKDGNVNLTTL